jgi:hypothetical protein
VATLGNVNIDGLDLSSGMRNDLASGMSVSAFNSKYAGSGFKPIASSRQGAAAAAPTAVATAAPAAAPDPDAAYRQALQEQVGGLFGEAESTRKGMQNPLDIYTSALGELGLTDARTRVTDMRQALFNTENLLKALPGDVQARTQDFNVSENQRRKILAGEQAGVSGQVDQLSGALDVALGDYGMILGEGKTRTDYAVEGQNAQRQALMENLQTAIGRSKDAEQTRQWQAELDRLKAQDAEEARQFEMNYKLEQSKAATAAKSSSSSSSSSASKSANQTKAQQSVYNTIVSGNYRGADGYIGPNTYKQMKAEWVGAGYPAQAFDANFRQFANPSHPKDYGL